MAYAEETDRNYRGAEVSRSTSTVNSQLITTRDNLRSVRAGLWQALNRVRGPTVEPASARGDRDQRPDPDHIVFLGEQIVELSAECDKLLSELAQYI
jgi:hypothetical protein